MSVVVLLHGYLHAQEPPIVSQSQAAKPLLFAELPQSFEVSAAALQRILAAPANEQIHSQLSSQFAVDGLIVDKSQHQAGTVSVNVRVTNYHNALLNLSVRLLADNSLLIQGRMLHPRYGDVLVLSKEKDRYFFTQRSQNLVMPE